MDASTRKYINELTQRIIDAYDISTPISDIESIVHMFGGVIDERIDFDDSCDGTIQKKGIWFCDCYFTFSKSSKKDVYNCS